jgi:hypothetical protein
VAAEDASDRQHTGSERATKHQARRRREQRVDAHQRAVGEGSEGHSERRCEDGDRVSASPPERDDGREQREGDDAARAPLLVDHLTFSGLVAEEDDRARKDAGPEETRAPDHGTAHEPGRDRSRRARKLVLGIRHGVKSVAPGIKHVP